MWAKQQQPTTTNTPRFRHYSSLVLLFLNNFIIVILRWVIKKSCRSRNPVSGELSKVTSKVTVSPTTCSLLPQWELPPPPPLLVEVGSPRISSSPLLPFLFGFLYTLNHTDWNSLHHPPDANSFCCEQRVNVSAYSGRNTLNHNDYGVIRLRPIRHTWTT